MTGRLPFMTKGPFAMFFGGQDILPGIGQFWSINPLVNVTKFPDLSDRQAGRHIQILYLVSIIFNLLIICTKHANGKTQ